MKDTGHTLAVNYHSPRLYEVGNAEQKHLCLSRELEVLKCDVKPGDVVFPLVSCHRVRRDHVEARLQRRLARGYVQTGGCCQPELLWLFGLRLESRIKQIADFLFFFWGGGSQHCTWLPEGRKLVNSMLSCKSPFINCTPLDMLLCIVFIFAATFSCFLCFSQLEFLYFFHFFNLIVSQ